MRTADADVWSAWIEEALMLLFLGGLFGIGGQMGMAAMQAREAQKNREFQEKMYKHRYQYQVDDLRKSGLNVAMAYGQQPPGPPGGAQAQLPKVDVAGQLSGAADANAKKKSLQVMEQQAQLLDAQKGQASSQALLNTANASTAAATARREDSQAAVNQAQARLLEPGAKFAEKGSQLIQEGSQWWDKQRAGRGHGETVLDALKSAVKQGADIGGKALWSPTNREPELQTRKRRN